MKADRPFPCPESDGVELEETLKGLGTDHRRSLERHLLACPRCRQASRETGQILDGLAALKERPKTALIDALVEEFRRHQSVSRRMDVALPPRDALDRRSGEPTLLLSEAELCLPSLTIYPKPFLQRREDLQRIVVPRSTTCFQLNFVVQGFDRVLPFELRLLSESGALVWRSTDRTRREPGTFTAIFRRRWLPAGRYRAVLSPGPGRPVAAEYYWELEYV